MARCYQCMKEFPDEYGICPYCGYEQSQAHQDMYYLPPGTLLGTDRRYLVGVAVNTGGFGIVYRAWDNIFNKMIAIKEYYPGGKVTRLPGSCLVVVYSEKDQTEYARGKEDFLTEARTVARFGNLPNVVDVYDFFEENNTAYMVMEYMNGILYSQYIRQHGGKLPPKTVVEVTEGVLAALEVIHKNKVVHCDIKPNNINIDETGQVKVKLFDFGAAYLDGVNRSNDTLTPCYAPPELYNTRGRRGAYTDIYSVGAMMYFALTGIKPEEATDRLQEDHLVPPHEVDSSISLGLSNTVMRAMALQEEIRFQNATQFREALNSERVASVEEEIRRRKRVRLIQVAATLAVLLAIGGFSGFRMLQQREETILHPTTLNVWVMADENDTDELISAEQRFDNMTKTFQDEYEIDCEVTVISADEYEDRINEAAEAGELPDIFDSTMLDPAYEKELESLDETCKLLEDRTPYLFLETYEDYFPDRKQMPLCFQLPLVFARKEVQTEGAEETVKIPETLNSLEDLRGADGAFSYSIKPDDLLIFDNMLGEDCSAQFERLAGQGGITNDNAYIMFRDGKVEYYLADTSEYQRLTQEMPAQFQVVFPDIDNYLARFDHLWSVSASAGKKQKKAAQWMIYYMLSDTAQNVLGVKSLEGIPLSRTILEEVFAQAYNGDLPDISNRSAQVSIGGSQWLEENRDYKKIWEDK